MKNFLTILSLFVFLIQWSNCDKIIYDCDGTIGFSSSSINKVADTGIIQYKFDIYNSGHGWVRGTGTFTVVCAGVYSISFTGYTSSDTKLTLKKRSRSNEQTVIISTPLGGGSQTAITELKEAEQLMIVVINTSGRSIGLSSLKTESEPTYPVFSFSAHRI